MSGGVMRELIRSFRDAATFTQLLDRMQIDQEIVQKAIHRRRQELGPRLTLAHRDALKLILRQGMLSGGQQEATEDELLRNLHLLSYQDNGNAWFDAHPNVLPLL
jgi:DnaJ-domain-containing protein 1